MKDIFIHFLDNEIWRHYWKPNSKRKLIEDSVFYIKLAILICGTSVYIPASNYFESHFAYETIDGFRELFPLGIIRLLSSSNTFEDFKNKKNIQYSDQYSKFPVKKRIALSMLNGIPAQWEVRRKSATEDIRQQWLNNVGSEEWGDLYSLTNYQRPELFENILESIPGKIDQRVFVASNAVKYIDIRKDVDRRKAIDLINTHITKSYISSYLNEYNSVCFCDVPFLGSFGNELLPESFEHVSIPRLLKKIAAYRFRRKNMYEWIRDCHNIELLELKESNEWKDILVKMEDFDEVYVSREELEKNAIICLDSGLYHNRGKRMMKTFIVHGHDETSKLELKNYIQNTLKIGEPIVLGEQPSRGRTIIEKFEQYSDNVAYVFVLLTPDDRYGEDQRARQNVIFEMGYFLGKLGRTSGKVILLYKGKLDLPSDISGLIYINIDNGIFAAGEEIRKELAL